MPIAASILYTLEYPKVLARLARACDYSLARERAEALLPETAVPPVRRMLAETTEARALLASIPEIGVGGARDVREPVRLAALGVTLNPAQLLDIRDTAVASRTLRRTIIRLQDASQRFPVILDHAAALGDFTNLDATITAAISPRGDVLDSASDELRRIRIAVRTAQSRLMEYMNGFIRGARAAALQEPIITERVGRYVVPVRAEQKASVPGIVHDTSASGQTLFVEPMEAVEMNNRWRTLQIDEEREIERILQALTAFVAKEADALERAMDGLAAIDFALAKARLAAEMRANAPRLWTADDVPKQSPEGAHPTLRLDLDRGAPPAAHRHGRADRYFARRPLPHPRHHRAEHGRQDGRAEDRRAPRPDDPIRPAHPRRRAQHHARLREHLRGHRRRAEHRAVALHLQQPHDARDRHTARCDAGFARPARRTRRGHRPGGGLRARPRPDRDAPGTRPARDRDDAL